MNFYIFVLGRQPEIGLAELRAVFGDVELLLPTVAVVKSDTSPDINRLGGARKVGRIIYDDAGQPGNFLVDRFSQLPEGKITLGVSHYGRNVTAGNAQKTGVFLKKQLGRSVRVLPNSSAEIADASSLGNKLGKSPNKIELMMVYLGHRLVIAELVGVQDLNAYTFRDRSRPRRDARVGMLPPKLAQIMINLAVREADTPLLPPTGLPGFLLDPFCGTGVVLQEAALMGVFSVYGTDLEPRMVDYTKANLEWLKQKYHLDFTPKLAVGDATEFHWMQPLDAVVCETYLGQPYTTAPPIEKLRENMATCNTIIEKFLRNLHGQIHGQTGICIAVPVWFVGGRKHHLPVIDKLGSLGYKTLIQPLIYARDDQIVGRELLVLAKK